MKVKDLIKWLEAEDGDALVTIEIDPAKLSVQSHALYSEFTFWRHTLPQSLSGRDEQPILILAPRDGKVITERVVNGRLVSIYPDEQ